eukprot:TRINITY_DN7499_c0_g1_i1.p1 TRINITY_DN7499_c0_g1~~TRINITY_DN7499_c0_g1_i1.p1  ORF type:complete len:235 (+),score=92.40 TRINITY_DN7499_c0_g1_i1:547-1251(+)
MNHRPMPLPYTPPVSMEEWEKRYGKVDEPVWDEELQRYLEPRYLNGPAMRPWRDWWQKLAPIFEERAAKRKKKEAKSGTEGQKKPEKPLKRLIEEAYGLKQNEWERANVKIKQKKVVWQSESELDDLSKPRDVDLDEEIIEVDDEPEITIKDPTSEQEAEIEAAHLAREHKQKKREAIASTNKRKKILAVLRRRRDIKVQKAQAEADAEAARRRAKYEKELAEKEANGPTDNNK